MTVQKEQCDFHYFILRHCSQLGNKHRSGTEYSLHLNRKVREYQKSEQ